MVEEKGSQPSQVAQPQVAEPAPPRPEQQRPEQQASKPAAAEPAVPPPVPAPPVPQNGDEAARPPSEQPTPAPARPDASQAANQAAARPVAPTAPQAPVFDFAGTESESNAIALGPDILPAKPDNRFRNRPPVYPADAAMHGEHGVVLVLIHVSEFGTAAGVEVTASSGVSSLDQAAVSAVRKWHFHPALKEGRSVPSDMALQFVFEAN
jgi:protein TonB